MACIGWCVLGGVYWVAADDRARRMPVQTEHVEMPWHADFWPLPSVLLSKLSRTKLQASDWVTVENR